MIRNPSWVAQGAAASQWPTTTMLIAMLIMTFAFWAYSFAVVFTRVRAIVLEQESDTEWVRALVTSTEGMKR